MGTVSAEIENSWLAPVVWQNKDMRMNTTRLSCCLCRVSHIQDADKRTTSRKKKQTIKSVTCKLCIKWDSPLYSVDWKTISSEQTLAYWVNVEQIQWVAGWRAWTWDHPFIQTQQPWPLGYTASTRSFNNLLYKKISIILTLWLWSI